LLPGRKRESQRTDSGLLRADGTTKHTNKHENLTTDGSDGHGYGEAGLRLASQAGAAFSKPSASQLARDSENTSLTRCAGDPAGARIAPEDRPSEVADAFHGPRRSKLETAEGGGEGTAGGNQQADSAEFLEGHSQAGLQMDSEKLAAIRSANDSRASGANASSAEIGEICGKQSDVPDGAGLRPGEFFAVKDVSFELRRGELRTLGQSEKEVSKKCLGATKVPDSGRRRHQCLGLIGHNGALPALLALAG